MSENPPVKQIGAVVLPESPNAIFLGVVKIAAELKKQEEERANAAEKRIQVLLGKESALTASDLGALFEKRTTPASNEKGAYSALLPEGSPLALARLGPVVTHEDKYLSLSVIGQDARTLAFYLYFNNSQFQQNIAADRAKSNLADFSLTAEWETFYRDALPDMAKIAHLTPLLHECIKLMAEQELGKLPPTESINLRETANLLARVIQLNFLKHDFVISTPETRQPLRNEIVIDIDPDVVLNTNPALLIPSLLQHLTNAAKAISAKNEANLENTTDESGELLVNNALKNRVQNGKLPKEPQIIYLRISKGEGGMVNIEIENSGRGIDVASIVHSIRDLLSKNKIERDQLDGFAEAILDENGEALTVKRAFQFAEHAGVSGFLRKSEHLAKASSGNGLAIAKYLIARMDGTIDYDQSDLGGLKVQMRIPADRSGQAATSATGEVVELVSNKTTEALAAE